MQVVITGGAGFIGSHVADAFLARGEEVVVVDDLSTGSRELVPEQARLVELDIADADRLHEALAAAAPDVICHLAAQASVTVSVSNPDLDFASNVFASTGGAIYGAGAPLPTPETHVPEPLAPYGASKLAGEAFVATQARYDGLPNVILRLGNVYGPRQNPQGEAGVVAIFSDGLLRGEEPVAYGRGRPRH